MGFDTPSGGGGAPTDAPYLTESDDPDLSNETVINNPENVPNWTEDPNSPFEATGVNSATFSLSKSFEFWALYVKVDNNTTGGAEVDVRVNGDTGTNYNYVDHGGGQTTKDDRFANVMAFNNEGSKQARDILRFGQAKGRLAMSATTGWSGGVSFEAGDHEQETDLSSITLMRGESSDFRMEAYGQDLGI